MRCLFVLLLLLTLAVPGRAQYPRSIDNPVLEGVADAGVLKYNGEYYIMGVGTGGDLYVSSDLVHWRGPEPAFSMNNAWTPGPSSRDCYIHANDFEYVNGTFHLYWSVNYWGEPEMTVHIGHATADSVMGPYREPVTTTWFDSRIDPHLFIDDDGTPYFYSVKFTDGNVIYGQRMADPGTLVGEPRFLLSALPDTWEMRAHRVNEGAEVDKYRGRYYMLYAANHVGARWGQYAIGVAEADHPLGFNNATKYAHPVIGPTNEERIAENAHVILPIGESTWRYTTTPPAGPDWTAKGYDDSGWTGGEAAFGSRVVENSTTNRTHTSWEIPEIWLRKTFRLDEQPSKYTQLLMRLHGSAEIYVNGVPIHESDGVPYYTTIDVENVGAFRQGENVLAVHARQEGGQGYVDVGLLDPQTHPGEAYIFSPGQPNLVRGPNGFEWWLVYFGRFNASGKSQAVDRVYFFGNKLHVDGPTGPRTPGYHPPPRPPTVGDLFNEEGRTELGPPWQTDGGRWRVRDGEAVQLSERGTSRAVLREPAGTHYLFETGVRFLDEDGREAGVIAYVDGAGDRLVVSLNQEESSWTYRLIQNGCQVQRSFALPDTFNYGAYHTLRVTKNGGTFHVDLDGRPAPGQPAIETELVGRGRPALYTRNAQAAFDGVIYTRGWDEFGTRITGWKSPQSGSANTWRVDATGLYQTVSRGRHSAVKGDPLAAYEFSTQVHGDVHAASSGDARERRMGFLPVYVDSKNWLRAEIDMDSHRLVVERMRNGKRNGRWTVDLAYTKRLYPDATYSDPFAKRYTFRSPTLVDALHIGPEGEAPLPASWKVTYRHEGSWKALPRGEALDPVLADALRVEVGDDDGEIGTLTAHVLSKSSYNLRAVKLPGEVIIFVDGKQVLRIPGDWPPSRVGLTTRNMKATYDGLLRFDIPPADTGRGAR